MIDLNEMMQGDTIAILDKCEIKVRAARRAYHEYMTAVTDCEECKKVFADELADIITCAQMAAAVEDIDIESKLCRTENEIDKGEEK